MHVSPYLKNPDFLFYNIESYLHFDRQILKWLEILAIFSFALLLIWVIAPLRMTWLTIGTTLLALLFTILGHFYHKQNFTSLGLNFKNFMPCAKRCLYFSSGIVVIIAAWGWLEGSLQWKMSLYLNICGYFIWACFQQIFFQLFFTNRLKGVLKNSTHIAFVSALIFGFIHFPNYFLMGATFVSGFFWACIYLSYPNLYAIGLSHALLAVLLKYSLPNILVHGLKIGPGY